MEKYEYFFNRIDKDYRKIKEFDKQTLFSNIYYFWCLHHFFSMYHIWKPTALTRLEREKWVTDLPNVNLFLERIRERDETVKPILFFYNSKGYFKHLFLWKIVKEDEWLKLRHLIKLKRHKKTFAWQSVKAIR